jgi:hypothetical protein
MIRMVASDFRETRARIFLQRLRSPIRSVTPSVSYRARTGKRSGGPSGRSEDDTWYPALADASASERVLTYYTRKPSASDSVRPGGPHPGAWRVDQGNRAAIHAKSHSPLLAEQRNGSDTLIETQYSYDPHGNVEWVRHELPDIGRSYIEYD